MKLLTVIGARPQFIKAAALSRLFKQQDTIHEILIHTGQHYNDNMSEIFFTDLEIPEPNYNLGVGSASHGVQTGEMLTHIEEILLVEKPDVLLVYGDTNSTIAAALAASKLHIPIAHVEAGLRSYNRRMPEETNRVITDRLSQWLFTPTTTATKNLQKEGITKDMIHQVGDVMFDVALYYGKKAEHDSNILDNLNLTPNNYSLVTIHRAENTDDRERLQRIIEQLILAHQDVPLLFPMHPRTKKALSHTNLLDQLQKHCQVIEPVGFLDMIQLEKNAELIITDSGGIQKEAFFHGVPCITLRDETEWVETVELGWNKILPPTVDMQLLPAINTVLKSDKQNDIYPYGDGNAAEKVISLLKIYENN